MSHFIQNLIDRHQQDGVSPVASRIAQPRAKARFESDSRSVGFMQNDSDNHYDFEQVSRSEADTKSDLPRYHLETTQIRPANSEKSSIHTQAPAQQSIDTSVMQTDTREHIGDLSERIDLLTLNLGEKSPVQEHSVNVAEIKTGQQTAIQPEWPESIDQSNSRNLSFTGELNKQTQGNQHFSEPPVKVTEYKTVQQTENQSEWPEIIDQSKSQNLSITDELNQSIQTILHQLNSQKPQANDDQIAIEPQRVATLSNTDNNEITRTVPLLQMPKTTSDIAEPKVKSIKPVTASRSEQRQAKQDGLLLVPNWLTAMQVDLNNRWQEMNSKEEVEPVVNVTIGRVEVRAVQSNPVKQPKTANKPSGVMSLDDYLKQREHRGQA